MKKASLAIIFLLVSIVLVSCEIHLLPDNSSKIQDQLSGLQRIIINADTQMRITPEVITHSDSDVPAFMLNIERHGSIDVTAISDAPGSALIDQRFDYYADVPISIKGNEVYGVGYGPGTFTKDIPGYAQELCEFEMEYKVEGEFTGRPDCALELTIQERNRPGDCELVTNLATYNYPWPGTTLGYNPLGPHIFKFEVGMLRVDVGEFTQEIAGLVSWESTYSLRSFTTVPPPLYDCDIDPDVYEFGEAPDEKPTPDN